MTQDERVFVNSDIDRYLKGIDVVTYRLSQTSSLAIEYTVGDGILLVSISKFNKTFKFEYKISTLKNVMSIHLAQYEQWLRGIVSELQLFKFKGLKEIIDG